MTNSILAESTAVGSLIGLAVGDALGAPVEFCERGSFDEIHGMRAGGRFKLPAGAWTDDTAMALCLAHSLCERSEFDEQDLLLRFCHWVERADWTSTGKCVGIGQNTLMALGNFRRTGALQAPPNGQKSDGNGSIMRLAPVAIFSWRNVPRARDIARRQSLATHHSAIAAVCSEYLVEIICALICGHPWREACDIASNAQTKPLDVMDELCLSTLCHKDRSEIRASGYCLDALKAALWAVETTTSFQEALLKAVNLGEDADTVGAIAGQLAGARYGYHAIPADWLKVLKRRDDIVTLAQKVFAKGREITVEC